MRKLLLFFCIVVWLASCSTIDCPLLSTISVQYVIRDKAGKALTLTDSLTIISIQKSGEIVVLNRLSGKSEFSLPASYSHPEDVLFFRFKDKDTTVVDTVWMKKDDIPHFESVDCNALFFHEITDVQYTRHAIDSLILLNRSVTYDQTTIHFRLVPKSDD